MAGSDVVSRLLSFSSSTRRVVPACWQKKRVLQEVVALDSRPGCALPVSLCTLVETIKESTIE
jgi:hypothetical protein